MRNRFNKNKYRPAQGKNPSKGFSSQPWAGLLKKENKMKKKEKGCLHLASELTEYIDARVLSCKKCKKVLRVEKV